jgi:hypothetical protein
LLEKSIYGIAIIVSGRAGFPSLFKYGTNGSNLQPIQWLKQIFERVK